MQVRTRRSEQTITTCKAFNLIPPILLPVETIVILGPVQAVVIMVRHRHSTLLSRHNNSLCSMGGMMVDASPVRIAYIDNSVRQPPLKRGNRAHATNKWPCDNLLLPLWPRRRHRCIYRCQSRRKIEYQRSNPILDLPVAPVLLRHKHRPLNRSPGPREYRHRVTSRQRWKTTK